MRGWRLRRQYGLRGPAGQRGSPGGGGGAGGLDQPVQSLRGEGVRAAVGGEQVELGGGTPGSSAGRSFRLGGQRAGHLGVRAPTAQGQVPDRVGTVHRRAGQLVVDHRPPGRADVLGQHLGERGRGEADGRAVQLDRARGGGLAQVAFRIGTTGPDQHGRGRLGGQRGHQQRVGDLARQRADPLAQQGPDRLGQRRRPPGRAGRDGRAEGQRQERVAAAGFMQPAGRTAGQAARLQQSGQVVGGQRRHGPLGHRCRAQPHGSAAARTAFGGDHPDPGSGAAAHRETDQLGRLRVEPLHVVEDQQHAAGAGAVGEQLRQDQAAGQRGGAGPGGRTLAQGVQGRPLGGGQRGGGGGRQLGDQVGDPRVRQAALGLGRAQPQHALAPGGGAGGHGVQQGGLTDPGRAVQGDPAAGRDPGLDRRQQGRAPDQGRRVQLRVRVQGRPPLGPSMIPLSLGRGSSRINGYACDKTSNSSHVVLCAFLFPGESGDRGSYCSRIAAAGHFFRWAVTDVAVTVPSEPAAPCTVTASPALTSETVPLVAVWTEVEPLVLTVTTSPAAVCT
ncbi:MAG: hypothetical protein QOE51_2658 [Actinoplanes sp.]|nr:hypothetical protein [Actinoplanes sp.]